MSDGLENLWAGFFSHRTRPLAFRFVGSFRAVVVETNDPLRMHRVRFKIPELHDWDIKTEDCPWAVSSFDLGTKRCGRWSYPCIGDWIWISFEKNHPYGPIWTGFADPTMRKFYALPSIFGRTQLPLDEKGESAKGNPPDDYNVEYLPKDERPMSHGWQDRYGNLDMHSAVGFFPKEHEKAPPVPETDNLTSSELNFKQSTVTPEQNNPDSKMMVRMSKYGMAIVQADIGYIWKNDDAVPSGEFTGDFDKDEEFEITRWKYMQRVLHEDAPTGRDQRRIMNLTRYGHKFEMRDVGWNKTRVNEWDGNARTIGDGQDERWIKMRTKGGHLVELCDIGFDAEEDTFVKRLLIDEVGGDSLLDKEDQYPKEKTDWNQYGDRDARFIRFVTRSGIKLALDDRGSNDQKAEDPTLTNKELGRGALIKGRATPANKDEYGDKSGDPRGFYWQFDEKEGRNSTSWGTPSGQVMEMDDNEEFLAICSKLPSLPTPWQNLANNEFLTQSVESLEPAKNTHHLILDLGRELVRLKSRAGQGVGGDLKKLGEAATGEHAGLEVHDAPAASPWTELIDIDDRGLWFSRQDNLGIWRSKANKNIHIWLDDGNNNIVLHNAEAGKVQIYCQGNVEIISNGTIAMQANEISMKAAGAIKMQASGVAYTFTGNLSTGGDIKAPNVYAFFPTADRPVHVAGKGTGSASGGGIPAANLTMESVPSRIKPEDRL